GMGAFGPSELAAPITRLKDCAGLRCLSHPLRQPGHEVLALDLAAAARGATGESFPAATAGGPLIDAEARAAYKRRLASLRETLADAETCNDFERAHRARTEMDFPLRDSARG